MWPLLPGPTFCPACLPRQTRQLDGVLLPTCLRKSRNLHCVLHRGSQDGEPLLQLGRGLSGCSVNHSPPGIRGAFVKVPGRAPGLRRSYCWSLVTRCSVWSDSKTPNPPCGFVHTPGLVFPQRRNNHTQLANTILKPSCALQPPS